MTQLSSEQNAVVEAPLGPMSVIACAGSGKTRTAVHRLAALRGLTAGKRGRVALLSFSNVAVDAFRSSYTEVAASEPARGGQGRVEIDTLDAFITRHILHPHAYRTMCSPRAAFLVTGREGFLSTYTFYNGSFPTSVTELQAGFVNGTPRFYYSYHNNVTDLPLEQALKLVERLGQVGAYTHNLGRYWCFRTLAEQPDILRAFANRYPHILIDEAQDIGTAHQAILNQLSGAGVEISLIGDPNQGIYEFAGADGSYLKNYGSKDKVQSFGLTQNYRSVPNIVAVANAISVRSDTAVRAVPGTYSGPYFTVYAKNQEAKLVEAFQLAVKRAELDIAKSAVICRAKKLADALSGAEASVGQGLPKLLVQAAILRDKHGDYLAAFKLVAACAASLLATPPDRLVAQITQPERYPESARLSRIVWQFTRDASMGLPHATLSASKDWHPQMVSRVKDLAAFVAKEIGSEVANNLGQKLSKKELPDSPLIGTTDLASTEVERMRVDTVHQVKGEGLDAVLYIVTKDHAEELVAGVGTEVGRIGYVAVTRARNLFWLGIPAANVTELRPKLLACGFKEAGTVEEP